MVNNMISIVDVFKCDLFSGKNLPFGLLYKRLKLLTIHYHYHKKHEAGKSNMYNDVIIHHSVYCSHCSYWVRMKHRIVLYFICSKICTFFQFGKFLVVLVAVFLFTQEVEGWRRVRKFFRNVGTIVNRSFGNIGRFVSRFQSSINSSKSQTTNTDSKSSSSNEKVFHGQFVNAPPSSPTCT